MVAPDSTSCSNLSRARWSVSKAGVSQDKTSSFTVNIVPASKYPAIGAHSSTGADVRSAQPTHPEFFCQRLSIESRDFAAVALALWERDAVAQLGLGEGPGGGVVPEVGERLECLGNRVPTGPMKDRGTTINQEAAGQGAASPSARKKVFASPEAAVADIFDGAVLLIAGFAGCGCPESLLGALRAKEAANLTAICHGAWQVPSGAGPLAGAAASEPSLSGIEALVAGGQVRKLISPLPFYPGHGGPVEARWRSGDLEIEVAPQGILAERLRAGGAGLGGVFIPAGAGTRFGEGREVRRFGDRDQVFEPALHADFALLRADAADTLGNLVYRDTQRNWNPVMAMAARVSIAEVGRILEPGDLNPETIITPGIFINRIVKTG